MSRGVQRPNRLWMLGRWLAKGLDFFRQINADGAPGDAAATSDASRCAELIDPGGEFVREPHAIAVFGAGPEILAMDIAMIGCEAGVPYPGMFGLLKV